jgi:hypothetical protein
MDAGSTIFRMKKLLGHPLLWSAIACAALVLPRLTAATPPAPGPIYVTISYDDPIAFEHFRYGFNDGKDLILGTLRTKAAEMAHAAHFTAPIVVLDDKTPPPAGAPVLRLSWDDSGAPYAGAQTLSPSADRNFTVSAEYLPDKDAKASYLGVVSRESLAFHPTPDLVYTRIRSAPNDFVRRDETIKADTELNLFLALQRAEKHLGSSG